MSTIARDQPTPVKNKSHKKRAVSPRGKGVPHGQVKKEDTDKEESPNPDQKKLARRQAHDKPAQNEESAHKRTEKNIEGQRYER